MCQRGMLSIPLAVMRKKHRAYADPRFFRPLRLVHLASSATGGARLSPSLETPSRLAQKRLDLKSLCHTVRAPASPALLRRKTKTSICCTAGATQCRGVISRAAGAPFARQRKHKNSHEFPKGSSPLATLFRISLRREMRPSETNKHFER